MERDGEWVVKQVIGDINKFSRYVLIPDHPSDKDKIFRDSMGYGIEDAQELLDIYIAQVREKFAHKEYAIELRDQYGQRFTIEIELTGKGAVADRTYRVLSGWILDSNGTLKLSTPFTGFAS